MGTAYKGRLVVQTCPSIGHLPRGKCLSSAAPSCMTSDTFFPSANLKPCTTITLIQAWESPKSAIELLSQLPNTFARLIPSRIPGIAHGL